MEEVHTQISIMAPLNQGIMFTIPHYFKHLNKKPRTFHAQG